MNHHFVLGKRYLYCYHCFLVDLLYFENYDDAEYMAPYLGIATPETGA